MIRSYSELIKIDSFEDRFEYLKLDGAVGAETFGYDRWINQMLYRSYEWKSFRNKIILRDEGCDLGVDGFYINGIILIHHLNPLTVDDIVQRRGCVFDEDNAITTRPTTHNAIHYGDASFLNLEKFATRTANDTCPWKSR